MLCSNEHFGITSEDVDRANLDARNAETSRKEVAAWIADPPESYFVYVREERASEKGKHPARLVVFALSCVVLGVVLAVVAAIYPARVAARMLPAHALRSEI